MEEFVCPLAFRRSRGKDKITHKWSFKKDKAMTRKNAALALTALLLCTACSANNAGVNANTGSTVTNPTVAQNEYPVSTYGSDTEFNQDIFLYNTTY